MKHQMRIRHSAAVCLLLLVRIYFAFSDDTIRQEEQETTLSCKEVADTGSVQCSFTLEAEQIKNNGLKLLLEGCTPGDNDPICVKATVSLSSQQRAPRILATTEQAQSLTSTVDATGLTIGNVRYNKPYSQYSFDIASALTSLEMNAKAGHKLLPASEEAQELVNLGTAHRSLLQDYVDECEEQLQTTGQAAIVDTDRVNELIEQSTNAFDQAVKLHRGQLQGIPSNTRDKSLRQTHIELIHSKQLGHVYFYMSDLWSLQAYFDDSKRQMAKEYMVQAMELFRFCKETNLDALVDRDDDTLSATTVIYTATDQMDAAFYWGQSLMRLGMLQMSVTQSLQLNQEQATVDDLQDESKQEELIQRLTTSINEITDSIQKSQAYFEQAAGFFETTLKSFRSARVAIHPADKVLYQINLAAALQHMGENNVSLGQLALGTENGERALGIYLDVLEAPEHLQDADRRDTQPSVANLLFSLSLAFLQQADYDKASHYYNRAMKWYEQHEVIPANTVGEAYKLPEADGTIEEYEEILEEYRMLKNGASDVDIPEEVTGYDDEGGSAFGANEVYESAIHSALGYLYMSTGDIYQATSHMSQALFLTRKSAEEEDETLADLLYNMSVLKFSSGEFDESASYFDQAIQVFRNVVPEGENPLSRTVDSMDRDSIQALMHADQQAAQSEATPPKEPKTDKPSLGSRKVLTLSRIEDGPDKPKLQGDTDAKAEAHKQQQIKSMLNFNIEDFRSQLLNATKDEL